MTTAQEGGAELKTLEKRREELLLKLEEILGSAQRKVQASASHFDTKDESEMAHADHEKTLLAKGMASDSKVVAAIMRALARIDSGEYGICRSCEIAIPEIRLDAIPWAALCVYCKEEEGGGASNGNGKTYSSKSTRLVLISEQNKKRKR